MCFPKLKKNNKKCCNSQNCDTNKNETYQRCNDNNKNVNETSCNQNGNPTCQSCNQRDKNTNTTYQVL